VPHSIDANFIHTSNTFKVIKHAHLDIFEELLVTPQNTDKHAIGLLKHELKNSGVQIIKQAPAST
jgi:hypothetical protein